MKRSEPVEKMKFTDCLRVILRQAHGEAESEIYAYYQRNCSFMLKADAREVHHNPYYYHVHSAIWAFESLCQAHKDISLFERELWIRNHSSIPFISCLKIGFTGLS